VNKSLDLHLLTQNARVITVLYDVCQATILSPISGANVEKRRDFVEKPVEFRGECLWNGTFDSARSLHRNRWRSPRLVGGNVYIGGFAFLFFYTGLYSGGCWETTQIIFHPIW